MAGWHHPLNGHEFEQTPGDGAGQGRPGALQSMVSQSQILATEQQHIYIPRTSMVLASEDQL